MTRRAWAGVALAASISGTPYLDRHADDAVRWRGWSDSTLAEARSADRLILVSVGFFACHGCHIMERESFESSSVARAINELTVPVLIDRDDRPDLDARFAADLRRVGVEPGWPMTLWLLPDGRAISAATYLSPDELVERTRRLADLWVRDPGRLKSVAAATDAAHAAEIGDAAAIFSPGSGASARTGRWTPSLLHELAAAAAREGDPRHGGLRGAPKFPRDLPVPPLLEKIAGPPAREQATATLRAILASPLHDPVDGGFHRYSTDESWRSPHWEKLLDDNALLALDLLAAWRATGEFEFRRASLQTLDFVSSRLGLGEGRFAQALDSDGSFYQLAPAQRAAARRPLRDDSVIVAANAHAARAFARAGFWFERPEYLAIARSSLDALFAARGAGGLPHAVRARGGPAAMTPTTPPIPATLADHAALALAALEVFQASGEVRWLDTARALDQEIGERFLTAAGDTIEFATESRTATTTPIPSRPLGAPEILADRPAPSGAALALELAARLSVLDPPLDSRRAERARRLFARLAPVISQDPLSHADALLAGAIVEQPVEIVVAVRARQDARPWVEIAARHAPWRAVVLIVDDATRRDLEPTTPLVSGKTTNNGKPRGFVCKGSVCDRPAADLETFRTQLDALP